MTSLATKRSAVAILAFSLALGSIGVAARPIAFERPNLAGGPGNTRCAVGAVAHIPTENGRPGVGFVLPDR
jgi:hypothetical protein